MSDDADALVRGALERARGSRNVAVAVASLVSFALGGIVWAILSRLM